MQRHCHLHIGTEKTGTTTLQAFLHDNREALAAQGFLFTQSAGERNNREMSIAAFDPVRRDDATMALRIRTQEELAQFQRTVVEKLKTEVAATTHEQAIFSSEHFHSRLVRPSEIERLKEIVKELGFTRTTVVVYLRRPAELATSLFSTAVKSGSHAAAPPEPGEHYWDVICNHQRTLLKWSEVFGAENVVPRLFTRQDLVGGHIVNDFLGVLGIPLGSMRIPANQNEGLSQFGIEVLRRLNVLVPSVVEGKQNPLRRNIALFVERHLTGPKFQMPPEQVARYDKAFRDSDEWVREKYFPHKAQLFSYDLPPPQPNDDRLDDESLQELVNMIGAIWVEKHRRILHLEKTVAGR